MRWFAIALLAGCLPPDAPPAKPPVPPKVDADAARFTWTIADHLRGARSDHLVEDAQAWHGRKVAIAEGYESPWQGHCEEAKHTKRDRILADVMVDFDLTASDRKAARKFGIDDPLVEYALTCADARAVPPLVIFVRGERAMTCFAGTCYLLQR